MKTTPWLLAVLLLGFASISWGCDTSYEPIDEVFSSDYAKTVLPAPHGALPMELRYHYYDYNANACITVRIFLPAGLYDQVHRATPESEAWARIANQGMVFSGPDGIYRVYGPGTIDFDEVAHGEQSETTQYERYNPQTGTWESTSTIPTWAQNSVLALQRGESEQAWLQRHDDSNMGNDALSLVIKQGERVPIYRRGQGVTELWDPECYPRPTRTPTPTTDALEDVFASRTPTPPPAAEPETPHAPAPTEVTRELVIPLREGGPCITVRVRWAADAEGQPRWGEPFTLDIYGMTYQVLIEPADVVILDMLQERTSPSEFRAQLLDNAIIASRGSDGSWVHIPHVALDAPITTALVNLWASRANGLPERWVDPRCHTTPTPTPRPVAQGPEPSPGPSAAAPTSGPTPATTASSPDVTAATNTPAPPTPSTPPTATPRPALPVRRDLAAEVLDQINRIRREHGLPPLQLNSALRCAAEEQARYLAETGQIVHTGYNGSTPPSRAINCGYLYQELGENLGQASSVTAMVQGWLNSPIHRANILDAAYTEAGVGVVDSPKGRFFVMVFGRR